MTKIKGFKGYDKNLKCKNFQYEIGKEYETDKVSICNYGFHFCEHPLDVFNYYDPASSRFTEVEGDGEYNKNNDSDTKVACTKIKIGSELNLRQIIQAAATILNLIKK